MIYDNEYCLKSARWLVEQSSDGSDEALIRNISGELHRFWRLGQMSVLGRVNEAMHKADKATPR